MVPNNLYKYLYHNRQNNQYSWAAISVNNYLGFKIYQILNDPENSLLNISKIKLLLIYAVNNTNVFMVKLYLICLINWKKPSIIYHKNNSISL